MSPRRALAPPVLVALAAAPDGVRAPVAAAQDMQVPRAAPAADATIAPDRLCGPPPVLGLAPTEPFDQLELAGFALDGAGARDLGHAVFLSARAEVCRVGGDAFVVTQLDTELRSVFGEVIRYRRTVTTIDRGAPQRPSDP